MPLPPSRPSVSQAVPPLSGGFSPRTRRPAYAPFKPSDSEQRSHGSSYRGCWHELSPCFLQGSVNLAASSPSTVLYNPKAFIAHAASLGQACAHCRRSSTAATRRCLGSVSVPVRRVMLSHPLRIIDLVGHYPTNKLVRRSPLPRWNHTFDPKILSGITHSFPWLFRASGYVTTRYSPFRRSQELLAQPSHS